MTRQRDVSVILLAGGTGTRMHASIPKQYLQLSSKPMARHSFEIFLQHPEVFEIIVVCEEIYGPFFNSDLQHPTIRFAKPGHRRQDSVWNGFQSCSAKAELICIHDSARPMIDHSLVQRAIDAGRTHGAATVGMPIKFTVKETHPDGFVKQTPNRQHIWEIQTPQVIRPELLNKGFSVARENQLTVTDDVSLVELIEHPVKLVQGCYTNLKITTPEDLVLAETICHGRKQI